MATMLGWMVTAIGWYAVYRLGLRNQARGFRAGLLNEARIAIVTSLRNYKSSINRTYVKLSRLHEDARPRHQEDADRIEKALNDAAYGGFHPTAHEYVKVLDVSEAANDLLLQHLKVETAVTRVLQAWKDGEPFDRDSKEGHLAEAKKALHAQMEAADKVLADVQSTAIAQMLERPND